MPTTSPDGIYFADGATAMSAESISAAEATSVQNALDSLIHDSRQLQAYDWANSAARTAQTGMTEGAIGYQRDTDTYYTYTGSAWILLVQPGGLVPIVPTSVAGTGVSVSSTGLVTFSASTVVNTNGCFTSGFRNYEVVVDIPTTSVALSLTVRLRVAGADNTAAVYDSQALIGSVGSASASTGVAGTDWGMAAGARINHASTLTFIAPALATRTAMKAETWSNDASGANSLYITRAGFHRTASGFDGFSLIASTGNMTGTLKIYGYN